MGKLDYIERVQQRLSSRLFKRQHTEEERDFTRERKLPFGAVFSLILAKSVQSLQCKLNWISERLGISEGITASAFSQARQKLSHTAFIELNQLLTGDFYEREAWQRYRGFRLCAIDCTLVRFPESESVKEEFGVIRTRGGSYEGGEICQGRASVFYDVLNKLAIDAVLTGRDQYERDLAESHLEHVKKGDLILMDRGYPSYKLLAAISRVNAEFVVRCGRNSFFDCRELLKHSCKVQSKPVVLKRPLSLSTSSITKELKVRLVRVVLSTGEVEVLATSLLDEQHYPTSMFAELYAKRWGIETLYHTLKSRLNLENFTGRTAAAVKQDFYSTIFITTLESIMTREANQELAQKKQFGKYSYQVNKAVSFHAIKTYALELLENGSPELVVTTLEKLFRTNTIPIRGDRHYPRTHRDAKSLLIYHRTNVKAVF